MALADRTKGSYEQECLKLADVMQRSRREAKRPDTAHLLALARESHETERWHVDQLIAAAGPDMSQIFEIDGQAIDDALEAYAAKLELFRETEHETYCNALEAAEMAYRAGATDPGREALVVALTAFFDVWVKLRLQLINPDNYLIPLDKGEAEAFESLCGAFTRTFRDVPENLEEMAVEGILDLVPGAKLVYAALKRFQEFKRQRRRRYPEILANDFQAARQRAGTARKRAVMTVGVPGFLTRMEGVFGPLTLVTAGIAINPAASEQLLAVLTDAYAEIAKTAKVQLPDD